MRVSVFTAGGVARVHFVGLVVVGVEGFAGEDVVDLAVALVFVDAHGAALFEGGFDEEACVFAEGFRACDVF